MDYKLMPTIRPYPKFDAEKDANALRKAMKGLGTDEKTLIDILTARTYEQRILIHLRYKALHQRDLLDDLISETSFNFRNVLMSLILSPMDCLCKGIHDTLEYPGVKKAESVCIEALFSCSNVDIQAIAERYQLLIKRPLLEHIMAKTERDDFHPLLTELLKAQRDPPGTVDVAMAQEQAQELFDIGKGKLNPKLEIFYTMLTTLSFAQLRLVFEIYKDIADHSVHHAIKKGTKRMQDIMLSIRKLYIH